jgi:hypothetical protein
MKKIFMPFIMATALFACSAPAENKEAASADDAAMANFKENSKVATSIFEAFAKKDMNAWATFNSDSIKAHGPQYGNEAVVGKAELRKRLEGFHTLFNNIKPNDIMLLPGVDSVTFNEL